MRLIFVRHGHPDYATNSLTPQGHTQAEAAAKRLASEHIDDIYSSPYGRAYQTAEYTAKLLNKEITVCDFIHEIDWHSKDGSEIPFNGHPWYVAWDMTNKGFDLSDKNWQESEAYINTNTPESVKTVEDGIDSFLENYGYVRKEHGYLCKKANSKTVAIFSHGGSSTAALAHILDLTFPQLINILSPMHTSITILVFDEEEGKIRNPRIEIMNDARHIENYETIFGV